MRLTRTFVVVLVGVLASFLLMASAAHLVLKPVDLAGKMQSANRSNDDRAVFERDFQRAHWLTVFLINPSVGIAIGLFVGLFQKTRASVIAAACLVPQFVFHLYANGWTGWSDQSLPPLLGHQLLIFLPAMIIGHYVSRLRNRPGA